MNVVFTYHGYEPPKEHKAILEKVAESIVDKTRQIEINFTLGSKYEQAKAANDALIMHMLQEGAKKESEEDTES